MKKLICLVVLMAGCGGYYNPQPLNNSIMMDYQMKQRETIFYPQQQQQNYNYYQEQQAKQQWWDGQYRKMGVPNY